MTDMQQVSGDEVGKMWGRLLNQSFARTIFLENQLEIAQLEIAKLQAENEQFRQKIDEARIMSGDQKKPPAADLSQRLDRVPIAPCLGPEEIGKAAR